MSRAKCLAAVLIVLPAVAGLSSCGNFLGKNVSLFSASVRNAQEDQVVVESGAGGLPAVAMTETLHEVQSPSVSPAVGRQVTVQPGDTLTGIAQRNGVRVADLAKANGLGGTTSTIRAGQKLTLPRAARAAASASSSSAQRSVRTASSATQSTKKKRRGMSSYKVKPGETLGGIAARHHTTVSAILKANGMKKDQADQVRAGQTLRMPAGR